MKTISIAGVPEHFNLPWHLAIEDGAFRERGIDLKWRDIPEGTGKMCQLLERGETDLAIILTEGIVKSIVEGNPSKIVQEYIASPLQWAIHVGTGSKFMALVDLKNTRAAISRYGSGSHLMTYLNAQNQGWDTRDLQFEVVNNLEGAISALTNGRADYFMWEHFTTKPLVDNGTFRRLGNCPTPWPCFVIAATDKLLAPNGSLPNHILEVINSYTSEFKQIPSIDRTLANRYEQQLPDIREWLSMTCWSQSEFNIQTLEIVQNTLLDLKLIQDKIPASKIVYS